MLLLDRQTAAHPQPRGGPGELMGQGRLQLRSRAAGQLIELSPGKTTIGSGPRCTVRIQQPGVQPVHCLIARRLDSWTVRRWAGITQLNGKPIEESVLGAGDLLIVGSVEFEVIDPQAAARPEPAKTPAAKSQPLATEASLDADGDAFVERNEQLASLEREVCELRVQLARRDDERAAAEAAWQALQAEAAALSEAQERIQAENSILLARLDELRRQLEAAQHDGAAWTSSAAELERELAASRESEAALKAQLAAAEALAAQQAKAESVPDGSCSALSQNCRTADEPKPCDDVVAEPAIRQDEAFDNGDMLKGPQEETGTWPANLDHGLSNEPGEATGLFAESSSLSHKTESAESAFGESQLEPRELLARPAALENQPTKKSESASFIERYSHMFTDDEPAVQKAEPPAVRQVHACGVPAANPRVMGADRDEPAGNDEEESIEQYMAKLLQRVRGELPSVSSHAEQPAASPVNNAAATDQVGVPTNSAPAQTNDSIAAEIQPPATSEPARHRPAVAPTTDLGALRALANETARLAISRHDLQKFRRDAVTKVIVSTLAGMTSLWLMLNSPDWRNVQFITACVALLVAAYWAGEAYRTLVESFRAAAYEGPESDLGDSTNANTAGLPIDVDVDLRQRRM